MERKLRITAATLGILLLVALAWGLSQWRRSQELELLLGAQYQRAFYEMLGHVQNVEVLLAKSQVSATPRQNILLLSEIWRQAMAAQANLTQMPYRQGTLMRTSTFLTQVGDFSFSLARGSADGRPPNSDHLRQIDELKRQAGLLLEELHEIRTQAGRGTLTFFEIHRAAQPRLRERSKDLVEDGFSRLEKAMIEFPTLIYDGPFSDHVREQQPKAITGEQITAEEAREVAARFVAAGRGATATVLGQVDQDGRIPAYSLRIAREGQRAGDIELDVSRQGGHVIWMLDSRPVGEATMDTEEAARRARQFLEERGFADMIPTHATRGFNQAVIPFAREEGGVILYPDQVKVTVALDDGRVIGFDALQYLMNHRARDLPRPRLSEEEARQRVHPALSVQAGRLALIPLETLEEVLTYEFRGHLDGDPYIVYINALTGDEERILKVIETDEGITTL